MSSEVIAARGAPVTWAYVLPLAAGAFIFLALIAAGGRLLADPDIYWHIATGRWILAHHALPHADPFSFTLAGHPWIAKEWLSQLVFAAAYRIAGWGGVVFISSLAIASAFAFLVRFLGKALSPAAALLLLAAAFLLAGPHLIARPHALAMPFMVAWFAALIGAADKGRAPPWAALSLMVVWANLHAGFTFGLALGPPLALDAILRASPSERRRVAISWIVFGALAGAAACLTPYGASPLLVTFQVIGFGALIDVINEWKPQNFGTLTAFELCLLAGFGFALWRGVKLPPLRLLLLLLLLQMALSHVRNGELLGLIAPLLLARPLAEDRHAMASRAPVAFLPVSPRALVGLALLCVAGIGAFAATARPFAPDPRISPAAAVAALKAAHAGRVFNDYAFGGYLIDAGVKTFIDGRTDLYGGAFTVRQDRAVKLENLADFLKLLDEYKIDATLLPPSRPAVALLDRLPGWKRLYGDDIAVVHVRVGATGSGSCALAKACANPARSATSAP